MQISSYSHIYVQPPSSLVSNSTETEYCDALNDQHTISNHIDTVVHFIKNNILQTGEYNSFIDVGAGPAHITQRLEGYFQDITILEPNPDYFPQYQDLRTNPPIHFECNTFESAKFDRKFDFALFSQMIYYIRTEDWLNFVEKARSILTPHGKALISLDAPRGAYHKLCSSLNENPLNSQRLIDLLNENNIPYELNEVSCTYKSKSREKTLSIYRVFTLDDCFSQKEYEKLSDAQKQVIEDKIVEFVDSCLNSEGFYEFETQEDYVILTGEANISQ